MEITEVRIKLMDEPGERLRAFCSITFDDCFVVRDLKIIEGASGPFVAMPSRKLTAHCPRCGTKNHLRAAFCNQCGNGLSPERMPVDADGRAKLYADIAHPINSGCREMIQEAVVREYELELERAKQPDYVSRYDDFDLDYGEIGGQRQQLAKSASIRHMGATKGGGRTTDPRSEPSIDRGPASPPAPKSATRNSSRPMGGNFGAGIFPEE